MKKLLPTVIAMLFATTIYCQHIKIDKRQLEFLKNENAISVVFKYDNIRRGGRNISELEYIQERKTKLNTKGLDTIAWANAYNNSKQSLWPQAFLRHLNETLDKRQAPKFVLDPDKNNNYHLLVDVTWIYSGYDVGIGRSPSKVKLIMHLFNSKTNKKIKTFDVSETQGSNNNERNEAPWPHLKRVENAFYNSGFKFGIALKRVFNKK